MKMHLNSSVRRWKNPASANQTVYDVLEISRIAFSGQQGGNMKRRIPVVILMVAVFASGALAQGAPPFGARGPAGGVQRGGRGAPAPPATGPIADMVMKIVDAINKQDAGALNKLVTPDAVLVDEDGHFDPVALWIRKLTATGAKTLTILGGRGLSPLTVNETGDAAWAAFNYSLKETVTPRGQTDSSPNEINGITTITFRKVGTDWQASLIHVAVRGLAVTPH